MKKEGRVQNFVIALFGIALVAMSIGFALYSTTLTIGGATGQSPANATVKAAKWDIHYVQSGAGAFNVTTGTGYVPATGTPTITNTDIQFTTTLNKPTDKFEFTIDVKNDGTFDANFTGITMSTLTAEQAKYLKYEINYDGATYNATTTGITGKTLAAGAAKTMTVTVTYVQPDNEADLPASDTTVNLTASLVFDQAQ